VSEPGTGRPDENPMLPIMIDNWKRLGLVDVSYTGIFAVRRRNGALRLGGRTPEFKRLKANNEQSPELAGATVIWVRGVFKNTAFGTGFYRTVGLDKIFAKLLSEMRNASFPATT
jgi:hypothetical protein